MNIVQHKTLAGLLGAFAAFVTGAPPMLHKSAIVALVFLALDSFTGWMCAAFDRNWSSHMMRVKLTAKAAQYLVLLCSCAGGSLLAGNWSFMIAGWWAIIAIEFHSNIENLIKWQKFGVDLGPAKPLLDKLSQFFAAGQVTPQSQIIVPTGVIGTTKKPEPAVILDADTTDFESADGETPEG